MADYPTPPGASIEAIVRAQLDLVRRISELERPSGTNIASLVDQVQAALVNLNATVIAATNSYLSSGTVNMANLSASGSVTAGVNMIASGYVNGVGGLRSVGAFNTDITVYPGARQPVWQNNNGIIGYAPSTQTKKTNIRAVPFTAENVRACTPSMFAYRAQLDIRNNPENEFYDPTYEVPSEAGLFAEDLIANGLEAFVIYEPDGVTPAGVDYAGFGAVANLVAVRDLDERITKLELAQP
tara:strand:- start:72 stop:794 length:723 start_codon:yes stop_codon:yes gene_type:complete